MRANGARLGIDGTRLCVVGYSAGVHPALLLALKENAGPTALRGRLLRLARRPLAAVLAAGAPRAHSLPILLTKAGKDVAWVNSSIDGFVAKARGLDAPVELVVHATGPHVFDVAKPDARTRAIMRRTLAFLRGHLLGTASR